MPKKTTKKSTKKTSKETTKKKTAEPVEKITKKKTSVKKEKEEQIKEEKIEDTDEEVIISEEPEVVEGKPESIDLPKQTEIKQELPIKEETIKDSNKSVQDTKKLNQDTEQQKNVDSDIKEDIGNEPNDENVEIIEDENVDTTFQDKFSNVDITDENALKDMLKDFSDMQDLGVNELLELQKAMEEVKQGISEPPKEGVAPDNSGNINAAVLVEGDVIAQGTPIVEDPYPGWGIYEDVVVLTQDMEAKIQAELEKKKKKKIIVTEDMFKKYCSTKRNKVWYHALWFLIFSIEDHEASKQSLYEALCNVTSKSAIDPLPEHTFYFGLINILRLTLNDRKIIDFTGDKLKINKLAGIDLLTDLLREIGPPISERPVISEEKKKDMFMKFLTDDFLDI